MTVAAFFIPLGIFFISYLVIYAGIQLITKKSTDRRGALRKIVAILTGVFAIAYVYLWYTSGNYYLLLLSIVLACTSIIIITVDKRRIQ